MKSPELLPPLTLFEQKRETLLLVAYAAAVSTFLTSFFHLLSLFPPPLTLPHFFMLFI